MRLYQICRAEQCSRCSGNTFEITKVDQYGYWLRCLNCHLQRVGRETVVLFETADLEHFTKMKTAINTHGLQIYLERTKQGKQKILQWFEQDYLSSRKKWATELSDVVSENEFIKLAVDFVRSWFQKQSWKEPDLEQAQCIAEVWDDILVTARAGSGKTATTVNRTAFLIKHCSIKPSEILLLAFNREAAQEINDRLNKMLGNFAPQAMTFHALAYALVHPEDALIYDDDIIGLEKSKTVQQVIDSFLQDQNWHNKIKAFMLRYFREDWEKIVSGGFHLSPEEMVNYRRSIPHIGLDGKYYKSSGEKRLANFFFEHDIDFNYEKNFRWGGMNYKPDFTILLEDSSVQGIVIEYLGMTGDEEYDQQTADKRDYWEKKKEYLYIEFYPADRIEDKLVPILKKYGLMRPKLSDIEIWHRIKDRAVDDFSQMISQFIGLCRKSMITPEDLKELVIAKKSHLSDLQLDLLRIVWKIFEAYVETLEEQKLEDFEGLLIRASQIIKSGHTRWMRKSGAGDLRALKYLFIDEYQDFTLLFHNIVSSLKEENSSLKLFCVGDDWQAINGFAGSDLRFFSGFTKYFPGSKQLQITSNYRSKRKIVAVGNRIMEGQGAESKAIQQQEGEVWVADINAFTPNDFEIVNYRGDLITPVLARLVYFFVKKGRKVAMLCRRGSGLPWYTPYDKKRGKFHSDFLTTLKELLPEEYRSLVVKMDTAHSFKGKEEEVVIVVDAVDRSYPLIHPSNIFFEVLGRSVAEVVLEEKRLFYVAASRAKEALVFVTESGMVSMFLPDSILHIDLMSLEAPVKSESTRYFVNVKGKSTFEIKSLLRASKYQWNSQAKCWTKQYAAHTFTEETILKEKWLNGADDLSITITDEYLNKVFEIIVRNGRITSYGKLN